MMEQFQATWRFMVLAMRSRALIAVACLPVVAGVILVVSYSTARAQVEAEGAKCTQNAPCGACISGVIDAEELDDTSCNGEGENGIACYVVSGANDQLFTGCRVDPAFNDLTCEVEPLEEPIELENCRDMQRWVCGCAEGTAEEYDCDFTSCDCEGMDGEFVAPPYVLAFTCVP